VKEVGRPRGPGESLNLETAATRVRDLRKLLAGAWLERRPFETQATEQVVGGFRRAGVGCRLGGVRDHEHLAAGCRLFGEGEESRHVAGIDAAGVCRSAGSRLFDAGVDRVGRHERVDAGEAVFGLEDFADGSVAGAEARERDATPAWQGRGCVVALAAPGLREQPVEETRVFPEGSRVGRRESRLVDDHHGGGHAHPLERLPDRVGRTVEVDQQITPFVGRRLT